MTGTQLGLQHRFLDGAPEAPVLLLLHGTGGTPEDLIPLAARLRPESAILAPAGPVSEFGAARWFRRLAEGVFDTEDVIARTAQLAEFIACARERYGLQDRRLIGLGFSNGANIAAATLLSRPDVLREGILFSAMMPLPEPPATDLSGSRVFLANGTQDPMAPAASTAELIRALRERSAQVTTVSHPGGHQITRDGLDGAVEWIR